VSIREDEWVSPTMKSRFTLIRCDQSDEEPVEIEFVDQPFNIGPPLHWHRWADERFTVYEGTLELTVGSEVVLLGPGQERMVPKGVLHTFRNPDPKEPVRFRSVHTPGKRFERFLQSMYDMDLDGLATPQGVPGFVDLMGLLNAHPDVTLIAGPPRLIQRLLQATVGRMSPHFAPGRPRYVATARSTR
jgi:mannose-6-phosphate isomerase-like protein (cupin superfamily)